MTDRAQQVRGQGLAGVAASLASVGRQTRATLGVAISGTIVGSADGAEFTTAEHGVWWLVLILGVGIMALALFGTGAWARRTAERAASLLAELDRGAGRTGDKRILPGPSRPLP